MRLLRPATRGDCESGPRPCPWRQCRHWLPRGACVLDVVEGAPQGLAVREIAGALGVTELAVRVVLTRSLERVARSGLMQLATGPDYANFAVHPGVKGEQELAEYRDEQREWLDG